VRRKKFYFIAHKINLLLRCESQEIIINQIGWVSRIQISFLKKYSFRTPHHRSRGCDQGPGLRLCTGESGLLASHGSYCCSEVGPCRGARQTCRSWLWYPISDHCIKIASTLFFRCAWHPNIPCDTPKIKLIMIIKMII